MKYILLALITTVLTSETCKNKKPAVASEEPVKGGIPACIQQRIDSIKKLPRWNPPAQVDEYSYNNRRVFLFTSDCCDFYNPLYDSACNYICAPHGGFSGRGDGKCPDFDQVAKHVRLVWKDERTE